MARRGIVRRGKEVALSIPDSAQGFYRAVEEFYERGLTDGLPVVPPTEVKVREMLQGTRRRPGDVLGLVPPRMGIATVEVVAVNAVMAGCKPEYLTAVLSAVEGMLEKPFNLNGVQGTAHNAAPLLIVSGPVVKSLGFNAGNNVFGGGSRANATVGRAVRLVLWNIGGGRPWEGDASVQGHPGKYTYCIAENHEDSPYEPFQVDRGFGPQDSCVTVFACEAPYHNMGGGLPTMCAQMVASLTAGGRTQVLVVLGPVVARRLASYDWSKEDVRRYLYERARAPTSRGGVAQSLSPALQPAETVQGPLDAGPKWLDRYDPAFTAPVVRSPEDILVVVSGGKGWPVSSLCIGWGLARAVTRKIQ